MEEVEEMNPHFSVNFVVVSYRLPCEGTDPAAPDFQISYMMQFAVLGNSATQ